jgi:hypothetical protein
MFQNQPQLFYPNSNNPAVNLLSDPMAAMAVKYSSHLADQGKAYVAQNVDRWFSISKLKYYFAVDTSYVGKKLMLLSFPFFNKVSLYFQFNKNPFESLSWLLDYKSLRKNTKSIIFKDWSVKYDQNIAVPPKLDKNAPDMYIPSRKKLCHQFSLNKFKVHLKLFPSYGICYVYSNSWCDFGNTRQVRR